MTTTQKGEHKLVNGEKNILKSQKAKTRGDRAKKVKKG